MRYQFDWYAPDGVQLGAIQAVNSLVIVRTESEVGALSLTLPLGGFKPGDWRVGQILEAWREKAGTLTLHGETAYFVQDWEYSTVRGEDLITVYASDANCLLATRIIADYTGTNETEITGAADNLMKTLVKAALGSDATGGRQLPGFTVQAPVGQAPTVTRSVGWTNLLDTCRELTNAATELDVYTAFDVVRTAPMKFEFRTYTGQRGADHRRSSGDVRLVGEQYGNLEEARRRTAHGEEANYIYAGGKGEGSDRYIKETSDPARIGAGFPWNRKELWVDARNQDDNAGVDADAEAALREGRPKVIVSGRLVDTPGMQYGLDYQWGDVLSVEAFGEAVDCHVASVRIDYNASTGEKIDVVLRGDA